MPSNASVACRLLCFTIGLFVFAVCGFVATVRADTIMIVAFGASNTAGKGVSSSEAWPAQLESMLKARGYDVSMTVEDLIGDTSAGILSRTDSIPAGTKVVLYDTGRSNDRKAGVADAVREANIAGIASEIRARGATPIMVSYMGTPPSLRQSDGIHLTPAAHARIAAQLLSKVIAAIEERH